ncbi:unnamed protein product [Paramecium sonneborni]|uniref:Uncharacterized protein n=1 Tax=Paramecium sonneborni TaxID=65129 RepID=A0A8S1Q520_9CILI|nr:unnamed protein product [Paramecium sonneborni]
MNIQINKTLEINDNDIYENDYKQKKIKKRMLKMKNYFIFQRNLAFFFNFVVQEIIKLQTKIKLANAKYYRLIYVITKNQMIYLEIIVKKLKSKDQDNFKKQKWEKFLESQEYQKLIQQIQMDEKNSFDFFNQISKNCNIVQQEELMNGRVKSETLSLIENFQSIQNNIFEANDTFLKLYRDIIEENLKLIKNLNSKEIEIKFATSLSINMFKSL